jgi:hypothetical protein
MLCARAPPLVCASTACSLCVLVARGVFSCPLGITELLEPVSDDTISSPLKDLVAQTNNTYHTHGRIAAEVRVGPAKTPMRFEIYHRNHGIP